MKMLKMEGIFEAKRRLQGDANLRCASAQALTSLGNEINCCDKRRGSSFHRLRGRHCTSIRLSWANENRVIIPVEYSTVLPKVAKVTCFGFCTSV
jgi:hypothetical protein